MHSTFTARSRLALGIALIFAIVLGAHRILGRNDNTGRIASRYSNAISRCIADGKAGFPALKERGFSISNVTVAFRVDDFASMSSSKLDETKPDVAFLSVEEYLQFLIGTLLKNTPYEGRFAINKLPTDNVINLYFLDCDVSHLIPAFKQSSCTYIGYLNAILCRKSFFEELFTKYHDIDRVYDLVIANTSSKIVRGSASPTLRRYVSSALKQNALTWYIAHEVGHAVKHKAIVMGSGKFMHFSYQYNRNEREADEFFAQILAHDIVLQYATNVPHTIGEFIEQEYRDIVRKVIPELDEAAIETRFLPTIMPIVVPVTPGDFPLIVRALNIRRAIADAGLHVDGTGYSDIVAENVTVQVPLWGEHFKLVLMAVAGTLLTVTFYLLYRAGKGR
jgi:hypothetical protein